MRDEKAGKKQASKSPGKSTSYTYVREMKLKEERSKQGHTNNKAKQHSTPEAVTFPKKNELPRVGLEPTTLYTLDRVSVHVQCVITRTCTCECMTEQQMTIP